MKTTALTQHRRAFSPSFKRTITGFTPLALMAVLLLSAPHIQADSAAPAVVPASSTDNAAAPSPVMSATKPEPTAEKSNVPPEKKAGGELVDPPATPEAELEEKWGINVLSTRLTAAGRMIDFRYRVLDPEKAAKLSDPHVHPYIIDEATGAKFIVPAPPKVGQLRNTRKPVADKNYFMIFANPGNHIKSGGKISVVVGDLKIAHLTVE